MGFAHARRYLFTLYSSSKERERASAGRYGVGFWSVLLFEPARITVESRTAREAWAVAIDGELEDPRPADCRLTRPGTRVTLRRPLERETADRTRLEVERALKRYCRHLRRNDRRGAPLPVSLDGKEISEPLVLEGPCSLTFADGPVEGVAGLGRRPRIDLLARGLPAWTGTVLDELRCGARRVPDPTHHEGLAPVFLLNGNDLTVTLDRRAVIDDRSLSRVRRVARRRMRELLVRYLNRLSPRPLRERVSGFVRGALDDLRAEGALGRTVAAAVGLALLACAATVAAYMVFAAPDGPAQTAQGASRAPGEDASLGEPPKYPGPAVSPGPDARPLALAYAPPWNLPFRSFAAERLDPRRGIVSDLPGSLAPAAAYVCERSCVDVEVAIAAGPGVTILPVPTGFVVEPSSLALDTGTPPPLVSTPLGEPAVFLAARAQGRLSYRAGPAAQSLAPERAAALLAVPQGMGATPDMLEIVRQARALASVRDRVDLIVRFAERRLAYDRSPAAAEVFRRAMASGSGAGWLDVAAAAGRGDCDVKNAMAVALLRMAGVPSRLAAGVRGRAGRAVAGAHAWVEYHDGTWWRAADATGQAGAPSTGPETVPARIDDGSAPARAASSDPPPLASRVRTIAVGAGAVVLVAALALLVALAAGRTRGRLAAGADVESRRAVAAEMLASAFTSPETWHAGSGLTSRPLLPVLGNLRPMSLDEALGRGRRGTLWLARQKSRLLQSAVTRGARVLDASDPAFGALVRRLPGARDLDAVSALRPVRPPDLPDDFEDVGRLADEANRMLAEAGVRRDPVVPCLGLADAAFCDVDLAGLKLDRGSRWPSRFVALSTVAAEVRALAVLARERKALAAFLLVDTLLAASSILKPQARRVRKGAAAAAVGGSR
ncbi:MAG: transglutaminase domain-containing protein [Deltaproteobacteria bacterium]|nr:transglutaminase domain-containing protein [Deltaproteobacteria bacterium]